jgi:DNA invertase Pin-like site-specific DNA recombinase
VFLTELILTIPEKILEADTVGDRELNVALIETKPILLNKTDKSNPIKEVIKLTGGFSNKDLGNLKKNILSGKMNQISKEEQKILKVAAYCRVSTLLDEQKLSLQTQLAYYNFKILSNPSWTLAGIYADEGISGTKTERRDNFNRMIRDAKCGKIDLIITKSISRFSRNIVDALSTIKMLNELRPPCVCFFEKEQIWSNDPNSSLIISLMASTAEEEVVSLSNSISWGLQNLAKRGLISRNTDIYGFTIDNGNWYVVEKEANIIKQIYEMHITGKSINEIKMHLNANETQSPNGVTYWSYNTIRAILKNEKYIGDYEFQKFITTGPLNPKKRRNTGQFPKYYIENHHPPIVDVSTYKLAQEVFNERKRERPSNYMKDGTAGRTVYYKRIICAECGGVVSRSRSTTRHGRTGSAWRCNNSILTVGAKCDIKSAFPEKYLDYCFMQTLLEIKTDPTFRRAMEFYLNGLELTQEDINQKELLEDQMYQLNQELYRAVDTEIHKNGTDTHLINQITCNIIELREIHCGYVERLEKVEKERLRFLKMLKYCEGLEPKTFRDFQNMRPRINPGDSIYSKTNNAKDSTYIETEVIDIFPEDIYSEQVISATLNAEGCIKYKFAEGIEYGAAITYRDYQILIDEEKLKIQFEELIDSRETLKIRDYCMEPRHFREIQLYTGIASANSLYKRIINPLVQAGKLKHNPCKNSRESTYTWVNEDR